jgi:hypothetical protein
VNSTDTTTVGTTVTSPAAGPCAAVANWTGTHGAPSTSTGLPFAGMAVRLRGSKTTGAEFAATGLPAGIDALHSVQIGALRQPAPVGGYAERTSTTPGNLPPDGPLS